MTRTRPARAAVCALSVLGAVAAALTAVAGPSVPASAATSAAPVVSYRVYDSAAQLATGAFSGARLVEGSGSVRAYRPTDVRSYSGRRWDDGRWTSPERSLGFGASEVVASWAADTPSATWVQVSLRLRMTNGSLTGWFVMGRWAYGDSASDISRRSVPDQSNGFGRVAVDTFHAATGRHIAGVQLRVHLLRQSGLQRRPVLRSVGAMASALPARGEVRLSQPGPGRGIELAVPRYSQQLHDGDYPQWDGGGEAWCSPTSTAMVLSYWRRGPSTAALAWAGSHRDAMVDHAARHTFDAAYDGTGNWPFNTAYAGHYGLSTFVTRLRSLGEAELFIAQRIPLVVSVSFARGELTGAEYGTNGHLLVIVGFTQYGNVIVNDPFSSGDRAVRHVYRRAQFERVWLPSDRSGGLTYVMRSPAVALPTRVAHLHYNW